MNTLEFLTSLRKSDITITVNGEGLHIDAPSGVITDSLKIELKNRKQEILHFLQNSKTPFEKKEDAILPITRPINIPLSPSQTRLWSLSQLMPHDPSYNMYIAFAIEGVLEIPILEKSLQTVINRHEILRTTFSTVDRKPVQIIAPQLRFTLNQVDLRTITEEAQQAEIERLTKLESRTPFDLRSGPLLRAKLLNVHDQKHVLIVTMHHIISDGWSFSVFLDELSTLYEAEVCRRDPCLPPLGLQYADYSIWHQEWSASEHCQPHIDYWKTELGNSIAPLILPLDHPRPNKPATEAESQTLILPRTILEELNTRMTHQGITPHIIFLAAFLVVLFKHSDQEDTVICFPVNGRERDELQPLIGFFNNIVPMRIMLNNDFSILELLQTVRIKTLDALEHQEVPLHQIINEAHVDRIPLTRAMFDFQDFTIECLSLPGTSINRLDIPNGTTNFELSLTILEKEVNYTCSMEYKTALFENQTIEQMLAYLKTVLEHAARDPKQKLSAIPSPITILQKELYHQRHENRQKGKLNATIQPVTPNNLTSASTFAQNEKLPEEVGHRLLSQQSHNSLEAKMAEIWEELLGNGPIGKHENFFDLGGHSLLIVSLFSKIETVFGELLPLSTILHASTIEELTKVVTKSKHVRAQDSVVPIQIQGSSSPIFAAHPISGHIFTYMDLSRILGPDQPFYGLQSLGLNGNTKPFTRIEDMASHYIREIEDIQPQGPYYLIGGCMGGLVALEMAQQFLEKGKHVAFLGMMDTWLPSWVSESRSFNPDKFPILGQLWNGGKRYYEDLKAIEMRRWVPYMFEKIQVFFDMARKFDVYGGDQAQKNFAHVLAANLRAAELYRPKPYAGKITYFLASSRKNVEIPDPRHKWKAFARDGVEIIRVPASDSGQILTRPYVFDVSTHLQSALQQGKEETTPF